MVEELKSKNASSGVVEAKHEKSPNDKGYDTLMETIRELEKEVADKNVCCRLRLV